MADDRYGGDAPSPNDVDVAACVVCGKGVRMFDDVIDCPTCKACEREQEDSDE